MGASGGGAEGITVRDGYGAAMLGGGPDRAFLAAVAQLSQRELIAVADGEIVRLATPRPGDLVLLERAIVNNCQKNGTRLGDVRRGAKAALASIRQRLAERELVVDGATRFQAHMVPLTVALFIPAAGAAKIWIGLTRSRPEGFLVVLEFIALGLALYFFVPPPALSRRGRVVLQKLREEHKSLQNQGEALVGGEVPTVSLPLAVGLFGATVLGSTALAGMEREMFPRKSERSNDGGSATDGGDSGGGGDGGCGGCGGD